jgi:hypothetical protein
MMSRAKLAIGLSLLCALCACVFGAANASATTLFECVNATPENTGTYLNQKCTEMVGELHIGEFERVEAGPGVTTSTTGTQTGATTFNVTLSKVNITISCSKLMTDGKAVNEKVEGAPESVGSSIKTALSGCTVTPSEQKCVVKGEKFELPNSKSTTFMKTEKETRIQITPTLGTVLGEVTLEGCKTAELNKTYKIEGGIVAIPEGSNWKVNSESSKEGKLTIGGAAATIESVSVFETLMEEGPSTGTSIE